MSTQEPPEVKIERAYDARVAFARSMYHMAIQAAERNLDALLARAEDIRRAELYRARHAALGAAEKGE
jgi:hypothetical protein